MTYYKVSSPELGWLFRVDTIEEAREKRRELKKHNIKKTYIKKKKGESRISDYEGR